MGPTDCATDRRATVVHPDRPGRTLGAMGRPSSRPRRRSVAAIAARRWPPARRSRLLLLLPATVAAHPLGNFTINHYAGIRVEPTRDLPRRRDRQGRDPRIPGRQASTPTATARSPMTRRAAGAGGVPTCAAVARADASTAAAPLVPLAAGGARVPARQRRPVDDAPGVRLRRGASCADRRPGHGHASPTRRSAERIGWREIVATGRRHDPRRPTGCRRRARAERLTAYPADLIAQPLDIRSVDDRRAGGPIPPARTARRPARLRRPAAAPARADGRLTGTSAPTARRRPPAPGPGGVAAATCRRSSGPRTSDARVVLARVEPARRRARSAPAMR